MNERSLLTNYVTRALAMDTTNDGLFDYMKSSSARVHGPLPGLRPIESVSDVNADEIGRMSWKNADDMLFLFQCCFGMTGFYRRCPIALLICSHRLHLPPRRSTTSRAPRPPCLLVFDAYAGLSSIRPVCYM